MGLEIKLEHRLSQQLVITPQLKQAIKLLQLSQIDLVDHIQQEMVENPALEEIPGASQDEHMQHELNKLQDKALADQAEHNEASNGGDSQEGGWDGYEAAIKDTPADRPEGRTEEEWQRIIEAQASQRHRTGAGIRPRDDLPPIENTLSTSATLFEHLHWQLRMQVCTDEEAVAAEVMLHNLDDKGYLTIPLQEVADAAEVDIDDAEGAQMIVQALDPIGCGSLNLKECLVVQARQLHPEDPFFEQIICDHLEDFENRNYQDVARAMDMDLEDAIEYHKMLQDEFEPWPGRGYADVEPRYITPDVQVFQVAGEWQISLNEDGLPKLRISNYYKDVLTGGGTKQEREYIKNKLDSADFLIKSIYKRQATIERVVRSILRRQREFFDKGVDYLRPMVLKDIAEEIGVHESTVSRVTANKYMQCPHGILELKYFFNSRIRTDGGPDMAAEAVKNKIRHLIADENNKKPLSDAFLSKALAADGIRCARRTVAKYREAMGILPSSKRKKVF